MTHRRSLYFRVLAFIQSKPYSNFFMIGVCEKHVDVLLGVHVMIWSILDLAVLLSNDSTQIVHEEEHHR